MNAFARTQRAYGAESDPTRTPRSLEYEAIARITGRMTVAGRSLDDGRFAKLAAALHENGKLWTIFATEVADKANPLPQDLKARLFFLGEFTRRHTERVLSGEASIEPLIEINTAVMRGLRGSGA